MGALEEALGQERTEWPPSVLRGLWDALLEHADTRAVSPVHEARWWNLCGYLLRPGYGFPADDFRVKQLWKLMLGDQKRTLHPDVAVQRWICLRRIAGGFNKGQQAQLTGQILPLFMTKKGSIDPKGSRQERYAFQEQLRCVAAMELMDLPVKERLGRALVDRILAGQGAGAEYWALGRVGARHLLHGGLANVVSRGLCEEWLRALQQLDADENLAFVYAQLARQTEQREINVSRELAEACLAGTVGVKPLTFKEQERIYGDCLPAGLQLLSD